MSRAGPATVPWDSAALAARAQALAVSHQRAILGITGAPGAGKSTLAAELVGRLGATAVLVPMDGFHLAQVELRRLGRANRKGALDTFDGWGYVALLARLRSDLSETVYAPTFRRDLEEPIAGAIPVAPSVRLVVTEGNYLLDSAPPWERARALLDAVWYVDLDKRARISRLIARHIAHGRSPEEARQWAHEVDQPNAVRIQARRELADLVVKGDTGKGPKRAEGPERPAHDDYDLARFVSAQRGVYDGALAELRQGHKRAHWMWFVFPQLAGLGQSEMSKRYAISSLEEAGAYLDHPVLGARLRECAAVLAGTEAKSAEQIFGQTDALKLRSCMTLFMRASPEDAVFAKVLERYFNGWPDAATDRLLERRGRA